MLTTNIHACKPHSGRVRLTAKDGAVVWAEVYDGNDQLTGCGPSMDFIPAWARDQAEHRADYIFPGSMYWTSTNRR